jgi:O-antigen ligase
MLSLMLILPLVGTAVSYSGILGQYSSFFRIGCISISGFAGIVEVIRKPKTFNWPFILLGIFIFFAVLSSVYSVNWKFSIARSANFLFLFMVLMGISCSTNEENFVKILNILFWCLFFIIIVNFIFLLINRESFWLYGRYGGTFNHPNTMGTTCMAFYPIIFGKFISSKQTGRIILLFATITTIVIHIFTQSRSTIFASLVCLAIFFFLSKKYKLIAFISILIIGCLALEFVFLAPKKTEEFTNKAWNIISRGQSEKTLSSFTGRTRLWKEAIKYLLKRPMFGYGFDVEHSYRFDRQDLSNDRFLIYSTSDRNKFRDWIPRYSIHNGYISIGIGLGIPALLIWVFLVSFPLTYLIISRKDASSWKIFQIFLFFAVMGIFSNFFEYSINGGRTVFSILFWYFWAMVLCSKNHPTTFKHSAI